jgi:NAD(P)H-nitrite reductase large subunit
MVAAGSACHLHICEATARRLKAIGEGVSPSAIRSPKSLDKLAELFGVEAETAEDKARLVADKVLADLYKPRDEKMELVEMAPHPLPLQLEEITGGRLRQLMERHGVDMYCGDCVTKVERNAGGLPVAVHLKSGKRLPADLIVAAAGVRANTELLTALGAECNRGIVIDEQCRTSLPDIYAAGDVTEFRDVTLDRVMSSAIWPAARKQGRVAGTNMAGGDASLQEHTGLRASVSLLGTSMVSVGAVFKPDPAWRKEIYEYTDSRGRLCSKICYANAEGVLKAAIFWEDVRQAGLYGEAVVKRRRLGDLAPSAAPAFLLENVG